MESFTQVLHLMEYLYRHPMAVARVVLRNGAVGSWPVSPALLITTFLGHLPASPWSSLWVQLFSIAIRWQSCTDDKPLPCYKQISDFLHMVTAIYYMQYIMDVRCDGYCSVTSCHYFIVLWHIGCLFLPLCQERHISSSWSWHLGDCLTPITCLSSSGR